jgi:uncharacterized protein YbaR (Trm112 family)
VIDKDLLEILACPETHQPLALADAATVDALNASIAAGEATDVGGEPVSEAIEGGLIREDGKVVYPIRASIPVLLIQAGLPI